jgi:uncharacterized membrane protein YfcA
VATPFQLPSDAASDRPPQAPIARDRLLRLAVAGTAAGFFSGIFGVGGGSVLVPLLVLWLGYTQLEAAGTSLMAIALIAGFAAAIQGIYGNVHVADGLLVGVPAVGGVMLGSWLARRLPHRTLGLIFSAVLVAAAVELVLQ